MCVWAVDTRPAECLGKSRIIQNMSSPHPRSPYLFHIKDDNELQGCNGREKRWEKSSNPANGLPIDDPQDVIGNGKFLLSPALNQLPRRTVGHQEPGHERDNMSPVPATTTEPRLPHQGCIYTHFSCLIICQRSPCWWALRLSPVSLLICGTLQWATVCVLISGPWS